jgi:hypothetical protein
MRMSKLNPIPTDGLGGKDRLGTELLNQKNEMLRRNYERNIRKGWGRIVPVSYTELVEDADTEEYSTTVLTEDYYIGRLDAGQSGKMVAVLAALAIDGKNLQAKYGRTDAMVFLEILDGTSMTAFMSIIMHEVPNWIDEHWEFEGWVLDVLDAFLEHNDFFGLARKASGLISRLGVTGEQARALALEGQLPQGAATAKAEAPGMPSDDTNNS